MAWCPFSRSNASLEGVLTQAKVDLDEPEDPKPLRRIDLMLRWRRPSPLIC